jgi:hypothetical protein
MDQLVKPPSVAEQAAAVILQTATSYTKGQLTPITGRVPVWVMGALDAMSTRSGKSRNFTMNLVLAAGLDAIQEHLPEEVRQELRWISQDMLSNPENRSGEVE